MKLEIGKFLRKKEPVCAQAIKSRPMQPMARPYFCTGVGRL